MVTILYESTENIWYDLKISVTVPIQADLELDIELDYAFMLDFYTAPKI